jgi:hypothetical protein
MRMQTVRCKNCGHAAVFHHGVTGGDICTVVIVNSRRATEFTPRRICRCQRFEF